MTIQASKQREKYLAFAVDSDSLRKLDAILRQAQGEVVYRLTCSDGSTIEYPDLEQVLAFPNSPRRAITAMDVRAGWTGHAGCELKLKNRRILESVSYSVSGDERLVYDLSDKLDDWISQATEWYTFFSFPFTGAVFGLIGLAALTSVMTPLEQRFPHLKPLMDTLSIGLLVLLVSALVAIPLFPVGSFLIGAGVKRYNNLRFIRYGIIATLILGVLGSIIATLIMR
jgi:hypothetical protein